MLMLLTPDVAKRIAALKVATAAPKDGRPVLASVLVEWEVSPSKDSITDVELPDSLDGAVTFTVTDSFKLIHYRITRITEGVAFGELEDKKGKRETLINAAEFSKALLAAAKAATKFGKVVLETTAGEPLVVRALNGGDVVTEITVRVTEGKFPEFRKLIPDASKLGPEGTVGFNPGYLADLCKAAATGMGELPIQVELHQGEKGKLMPAMIRTSRKSDEWQALLMPVRL